MSLEVVAKRFAECFAKILVELDDEVSGDLMDRVRTSEISLHSMGLADFYSCQMLESRGIKMDPRPLTCENLKADVELGLELWKMLPMSDRVELCFNFEKVAQCLLEASWPLVDPTVLSEQYNLPHGASPGEFYEFAARGLVPLEYRRYFAGEAPCPTGKCYLFVGRGYYSELEAARANWRERFQDELLDCLSEEWRNGSTGREEEIYPITESDPPRGAVVVNVAYGRRRRKRSREILTESESE